MRRGGGNFEIVIKSPTLGLMTRVPGDQPDPRYAMRASNVRFDDGVIRNGPGFTTLMTGTPTQPINLIFQANVNPSSGQNSLQAVMICAADGIYALRAVRESSPPLNQEQMITFRADIRTYDDLRNMDTSSMRGRRGMGSAVADYNWAIAFSINDSLEIWKFIARPPGALDNGLSYILPRDWGAATNNNIFVRIS